ncbi:hypothetical protein Q8A73_016726 [Channa argus]|nr:hypothetical protein Q8A73_016726 [Channa argus]
MPISPSASCQQASDAPGFPTLFLLSFSSKTSGGRENGDVEEEEEEEEEEAHFSGRAAFHAWKEKSAPQARCEKNRAVHKSLAHADRGRRLLGAEQQTDRQADSTLPPRAQKHLEAPLGAALLAPTFAGAPEGSGLPPVSSARPSIRSPGSRRGSASSFLPFTSLRNGASLPQLSRLSALLDSLRSPVIFSSFRPQFRLFILILTLSVVFVTGWRIHQSGANTGRSWGGLC